MSIYIYFNLSMSIQCPAATLVSNWNAVRDMRSMPDEERKIERMCFTFQEAQQFLGVSHQTLYKLIRQGLPSHKIGRKRVFIKEELIQWVKEH